MKKNLLLLFPILLGSVSCADNGMDDIVWQQFEGEELPAEDFTYSYHPEIGGFVIEDYKGDKPDILLPEETSQDGRTAPVAGIAAYAFYGRNNLRSVALPYSIRYLGEYCFASSGLKNLYMTGNLTHIDSLAFEGFSPRLYSKDGIDYLPTRDYKYGFAYSVSGLEKNRMKRGKGRGEFHIPEGCVGFRDHLFDDYEYEIFIPQSCSMIGTLSVMDEALWDERYETWYSIEEGITSINITKFDFENVVTSMGECDIPILWYDVNFIDLSSYFGDIPAGLFNGYQGDFLLSNNIFTLGEFAFYKNPKTTFSCPNNLKKIDKSCFRESKLKSITLNEGLNQIGDLAFYGSELESIEIPSTVYSIGAEFLGLTPVSSVVFPASLDTIDPAILWGSYVRYVDFSATPLEDFDFVSFGHEPIHDQNSPITYVFPKSAKSIKIESYDRLFYYGNEEEFASVKLPLYYSDRPYFYSETEPETSGRFWHFVDDKAVAW